jgi:AraC family transcriptional regulator, transcriptional activator of pobA
MEQLFNIFELTENRVKNILSTPIEPHQHDHEEILIITKGNPEHFIDFVKVSLKAPVIIYVAQGKIHRFVPDINTRGWAVRYSSDFVTGSKFHFYSNFLDNVKCRFDNNECFSILTEYCRLMKIEHRAVPPDFTVIRHLLQAFLAKLEAEDNRQFIQNNSSKKIQLIVFENFLKILENNFRRPEGVGFYAERLNMSARNLNIITQNIFRKSVSDVIESRKIVEAKQLLMNSEKTVSEICFELGYNEKSYFTRVFRKNTGITPTDFRKKIEKIIS